MLSIRITAVLFTAVFKCNNLSGEVVPMPTLLFVASTDKVPESISKSEAVTVPVILMLPVPVMSLEFKSKSPPSWGVVSSTTLLIETACTLASV